MRSRRRGHLAPQQCLQPVTDGHKAGERGLAAQVDEHVDVALRPGLVPRLGAEQVQVIHLKRLKLPHAARMRSRMSMRGEDMDRANVAHPGVVGHPAQAPPMCPSSAGLNGTGRDEAAPRGTWY